MGTTALDTVGPTRPREATTMATHVFVDNFGRWYAAVEPGYGARRRARYAIRVELTQRGELPADLDRLRVQPATSHTAAWPEHELWCLVEPLARPHTEATT